MYIPHAFAEQQHDTLLAFMSRHPLATLVSSTPDGLLATHLPVLCDSTNPLQLVLRGHVAKANPHARCETIGDALVIFAGAQSYVSPAAYASKQEHGRVVPTWNYETVHVYGALHRFDAADALREHLEVLVGEHERSQANPWSIDDAPASYIEQQMKAIVGIQVVVSHIEGKWKMSQNRPDADIDGVVAALGSSPHAESREVAEIVAARRPVRPPQ